MGGKNRHKWGMVTKCLVRTPNLKFGTTKAAVPKNAENSRSTPTPCLDKFVLAQGGVGLATVQLHVVRAYTSAKVEASTWATPRVGNHRNWGAAGGLGALWHPFLSCAAQDTPILGLWPFEAKLLSAGPTPLGSALSPLRMAWQTTGHGRTSHALPGGRGVQTLEHTASPSSTRVPRCSLRDQSQ